MNIAWEKREKKENKSHTQINHLINNSDIKCALRLGWGCTKKEKTTFNFFCGDVCAIVVLVVIRNLLLTVDVGALALLLICQKNENNYDKEQHWNILLSNCQRVPLVSSHLIYSVACVPKNTKTKKKKAERERV